MHYQITLSVNCTVKNVTDISSCMTPPKSELGKKC